MDSNLNDWLVNNNLSNDLFLVNSLELEVVVSVSLSSNLLVLHASAVNLFVVSDSVSVYFSLDDSSGFSTLDVVELSSVEQLSLDTNSSSGVDDVLLTESSDLVDLLLNADVLSVDNGSLVASGLGIGDLVSVTDNLVVLDCPSNAHSESVGNSLLGAFSFSVSELADVNGILVRSRNTLVSVGRLLVSVDSVSALLMDGGVHFSGVDSVDDFVFTIEDERVKFLSQFLVLG